MCGEREKKAKRNKTKNGANYKLPKKANIIGLEVSTVQTNQD
jgi:hypothetical protein